MLPADPGRASPGRKQVTDPVYRQMFPGAASGIVSERPSIGPEFGTWPTGLERQSS